MRAEEIGDFAPVVETVNVALCRDEVAVPRLYLGRRPQAGVGDAFYGVGPVVYETECPEFLQDARACPPW